VHSYYGTLVESQLSHMIANNREWSLDIAHLSFQLMERSLKANM